MNLHEYQGKALFAEYNLPVSKGKIIFKAEDIPPRKRSSKKWRILYDPD